MKVVPGSNLCPWPVGPGQGIGKGLWGYLIRQRPTAERWLQSELFILLQRLGSASTIDGKKPKRGFFCIPYGTCIPTRAKVHLMLPERCATLQGPRVPFLAVNLQLRYRTPDQDPQCICLPSSIRDDLEPGPTIRVSMEMGNLF